MTIEKMLPSAQRNILLAPYTTYNIGGPADFFIEVRNKDELAQAVAEARREAIPYFLLGTGANILVGDKGFRGLVIYNQANNSKILNQVQDDSVPDSNASSYSVTSSRHSREGGNLSGEMPIHTQIPGQARDDKKLWRLTAESGATIAELIAKSAEQGLSGLEHFAGIPSSVGGAIWQNLHFLSPDRSRTVFIEEVLESAKVMMLDNSIQDVGVEFFEFGYDDSILHHQEIIVLEATFNLTPKPKAEILHQAEENLKWRRERQPQLVDFPSCGSVFKKIEGVGAGRLIDQVGLKGKKIGGAQISEQHANFLVNTGGATAADVMALAKLAQETVKKELGYELEMEIGLVGEF